MILAFDSSKSFLVVKPEGYGELMKLSKFPGLFNQSGDFYLPNKLNLVHNIYRRLSKTFQKVKLTPEVIEALKTAPRLLEIPSEFNYATQPEEFQKIALRYAYTFKNVGLLLEPGMGKTKVVLDFIHLDQFKLSLISCPKALSYVWEDEAALHRPELKLHVFDSTDFNKEISKAKEKGSNVLVINYDKVVEMESELSKLPLEFIGLDEGLIKNPSTERTKCFTRLSKLKTLRGKTIMSGTLVNNSPVDIFSPVRFLEPGLVGQSFTKFKETYTVLKKVKSSGANIVVAYKNIPEVKEILAATSIVMTKAQWLKLPPKEFKDVRVQMGDQQRQCYLDLASNYIATLPNGKTLEVDTPLTVLIKLFQIANGFAYVKDLDESDSLLDLFSQEAKPVKVKQTKRETYFFEEQPKIKALVSLLEKELEKERVVIWFNMAAEAELIEKALTEAGYKFLTVKGGEKNVGEKVRTFNRDNSYKAILCQARSVNYGVTILGNKDNEEDFEVSSLLSSQVCNEIFYSLNFSLEVYLQQQDRIHRLGQKRLCTYWRLLTNSAIEDKIVRSLDEKMFFNREILVDFFKSLTDFLV